MKKEIVIRYLSSPDAGFLEIIAQIPDPATENEEAVAKAIPHLQDFYLRKKEAYQKKDLVTFKKILDDEIQFVRNLDRLGFYY